MNSSDRWSSSSIPSTGLSIPEGTKTKNEEHGLVVVNSYNRSYVHMFIPKKNFSIALPPECRQIEWLYAEDHTELAFFISPAVHDEVVPAVAQTIGILI